MTVLQELAATAEICGSQLGEFAIQLLAEEISRYPDEIIRPALARTRRELKGRMTLAEILSRIDDGRPGPEQAWAMLPRSEYETVVWTEEMASASAGLDVHDRTGAARAAFRETYTRGVADGRASGKEVNWIASLGWDKPMRIEALRDAVKEGKLSAGRAIRYWEDVRGELEEVKPIAILEGDTRMDKKLSLQLAAKLAMGAERNGNRQKPPRTPRDEADPTEPE